MPETPIEVKNTLYSIQTVYNLYLETVNSSEPDKAFKIRCKNVIEVPVAEPVRMRYGNTASTVIPKTVIPATAITIENADLGLLSDIKIVIETNEGVTVEPTFVGYPDTLYKRVYLLYLPRGTTGIKKVRITGYDAFGPTILNDLTFDVMEAPYNYENHLFALIHQHVNMTRNDLYSRVNVLDREIASLESRVTALEKKAGS